MPQGRKLTKNGDENVKNVEDPPPCVGWSDANISISLPTKFFAKTFSLSSTLSTADSSEEGTKTATPTLLSVNQPHRSLFTRERTTPKSTPTLLSVNHLHNKFHYEIDQSHLLKSTNNINPIHWTSTATAPESVLNALRNPGESRVEAAKRLLDVSLLDSPAHPFWTLRASKLREDFCSVGDEQNGIGNAGGEMNRTDKNVFSEEVIAIANRMTLEGFCVYLKSISSTRDEIVPQKDVSSQSGVQQHDISAGKNRVEVFQ